jgi:hypothetical protein
MDKRLLVVITLYFSYGFVCFSQTIHHWETAIHANDIWHYHIGTTAPASDWNQVAFDKSTWTTGQGGFGYGDADDNTVIESSTSVYIRRSFTINDIALIEAACLHIDYDDGFVAYINGQEIARNGVSGNPPDYYQLASINHEAVMYTGGKPECFYLPSEDLQDCLVQGENVLAIQVHNVTSSSSDLSAIPFLSFGIKNTATFFSPTPEWFYVPEPIITTSNLPIVLIDTEGGVSIPDEPKVKAHLCIIDNGTSNTLADEANIYNGNVGIEIRGRYSASLPQKPYGFETRDALENNLNTPLWHMPAENDWILLANYNDKTFMRNTLAFHLFTTMGHYAPRTKYCEVLVNDDYQGIYVLTEKIKRDKGRVNIATLLPSDISGDELTGGYIFKVDYSDSNDRWWSNYSPVDAPGRDVYFVYHDPKPDELMNEQKQYIQSFVDGYESILYSDDFNNPKTGYCAYIDTSSFIDYFIIGEISRNVDAYKKSKYYYKDKDNNGGLIHSGPVWDFDWAWKDLVEQGVTDGSGWAYTINEKNPHPVADGWIVRLLQDPYFANKAYYRYNSLRETILSNDYLFNYIDSVHQLVDDAQARHYSKWDILGRNVGAPELGYQPNTYSGEITKFKSWIQKRLQWLDKEMGGFYTPDLAINTLPENAPFNLRLFPNPAHKYLYLESNTEIKSLAVFNAMGKCILEKSVAGNFKIKLDLNNLSPNLYIVQVKTIDNVLLTGKFIKQ